MRFVCEHDSCLYETNHRGTFNRHMKSKHDTIALLRQERKFFREAVKNIKLDKTLQLIVDGQDHRLICPNQQCSYKTHHSGSFKKHLSSKHDVAALLRQQQKITKKIQNPKIPDTIMHVTTKGTR